MSNNKKVYLELLRIAAILLVIFNHTDGFFLYYTNTDNPFTFVYSLFFSILCRVNVPLFFMISGALLLEREETLTELFRKRIFRIVPALLLFSFIHYAVDLLRGKEMEFSAFYFWKGVVCGTLVETYWFLYAYLGALLILPLLRAAVRGMKQELFRYLFVLETVMAVIVPTVCSFLEVSIPDGLYIVNVNIFYMLMGYALEHEYIRKKRNPCVGLLLAGVFFCIIAEVFFCCLRFQRAGEFRQGDLDLLVPVLAVLLFETVRVICGKVKLPEFMQKTVLVAGSCVFGVYLLEQFIRTLLLPFYVYLTEHSVGIIACTVYVLVTWLVSSVLVFILKKVPGMRKLL